MIADTLLPEFEHEMQVTRKVLERVSWDKKDWKPHDKSMSFGVLAAHLAESAKMCISTLTSSQIDMKETPYVPPSFNSLQDLLSDFDQKVKDSKKLLEQTSDAAFMETWTLRDGDTVYLSMPRIAVVRSFVIKHMVHHRGQLSVYLRLNDIAVPSIYGPSADEAM